MNDVQDQQQPDEQPLARRTEEPQIAESGMGIEPQPKTPTDTSEDADVDPNVTHGGERRSGTSER